MLHRRVQTPTVEAGGAQVSLSRHLATRAAKVALDTISKAVKGLPDLDPVAVIPALRDLHHIDREADALIKRVAEVGRHLNHTADALTDGNGTGSDPMVTIALEIFASGMMLKEIDPTLAQPEADETADHLREVAGMIAEDVGKARDRMGLVRDLLAEAVDVALTIDHVNPDDILKDFRPTARMRQELDLARSSLPETTRAIARSVIGQKRKEGRDKRLARQAKTRRGLQVVVADAWRTTK